MSRGANFAVSPSEIPIVDYVAQTELACSGLPEGKANELRSAMHGLLKNAKAPKSNITKEERGAIRTIQKAIKNKEVLVLSQDKGRAIVLEDPDTYRTKMIKMLEPENVAEDKKTYIKLDKDPTKTVKNKITQKLKSLKDTGKITYKQYMEVKPQSEAIPRMYALPKVHKNPSDPPYRPIVDYTGSCTYNIAKALSLLINPTIGKTEHHLLNSKQLVDKIKDVVLAEDEIWISHDVVALFPSVPVDEALEEIEKRLVNDKTLPQRTNLSPDDIMDLLRLVVDTTIFTYNDQLYKQSSGFPMGSGISPGACNTYMERFEGQALESCPPEFKPMVWLRYVDDVVEAIHKDKVDQFTNHLNSINPCIQFTVELQSENDEGKQHLPVLDVDIQRLEDGAAKFKVYKKSTHTDQYLNFNSHHPLHQKLGVIRTLFDRANTLTSTAEDKATEILNIKTALRACNYPDWSFEKVERKMRESKDKTKKKSKDAKTDHKKNSKLVVLPYVKGLSEAAARILQKFDTTACFRPANTLGQQLFKLKDKADPLKQADAIYKVGCKNCELSYIGETTRPLYIRQKEHCAESEKANNTRSFTRQQRKDSTTTEFKSALAEHSVKENHIIDWEGVKTLETVTDWHMRGIKEAIHIRSTPQNMNRPQGERYHLPNVWNTLLTTSTTEKNPTQPRGDQTRGAGPTRSSRGSVRGRGGRGR